MKKFISFLLIFIVNVSILSASSMEIPKKEKKHKCRNIGISKLNPFKAIRKHRKEIEKDIRKTKREEKKLSKKKSTTRTPRYRHEED